MENDEKISQDELREEQALRKERRMLQLRNVLNIIFMVLALVAMVGLAYAMWKGSPRVRTASLVVGIVAVLVKMVEASLRMGNMLHKPQGLSTHKRTKNN